MSSVDIIVPCYRYGHFLRQSVGSALSQAGIDVRVLIIDDASPDNTAGIAAELLKEDSRVTFIRHATNMGHIATYNEGIAWASSDYMLILSADDYLLPGALRRSADLMDVHADVGFTFGRAILLDERRPATQDQDAANVASSNGFRISGGREFIHRSAANNIVCTPTAVVRTALQKRLGGYRPELPHSGDMEMWLRFASCASVGILEAYQAVYRRHSENMSLAYMTKGWMPDLKQRKAALDCFFEGIGHTLPNSADLHHELFRSLGCNAVGYASTAFNEGDIVLSEQLSGFAVGVCPDVKRSMAWLKLACKRFAGPRVWHALKPGLARMRPRVQQ